MKKSIIIVLGVLVIGFQTAIAFHFANDIVPVFPEPSANEIEDRVTAGASSFFNASAAIMSFFAEQELNALTIVGQEKSLYLIDSAIVYLQDSKLKYLEAFTSGKSAGYKLEKIGILKTFNYDKYAEENKMNLEIMGRVKAYLSNGYVIEFYAHIADEIEQLLGIVATIKKDLDENKRPDLRLSWNLLQKLSEATLFGNYGTAAAQRAFGNY